MAWTYGFFNSVNGDRLYNAYQMSSIFEGLITNGVYESVGNKLAVQPNSGMTIQIATGRGWFNKHWVNNDSELMLTLAGSDVILNRYCAVCIRVDDTDTGRKAEPYLKYSDFATTPVKPTMTRTETINEFCLAYVYIRAGATAITAGDIEDTRSNQSLCGWVHGLIDQIDSNTLFTQYTAIFNQWFSGLQDIIDANVETRLVNAMPTTVNLALDANNWVKYGVVDAGTLQWYFITDHFYATVSGKPTGLYNVFLSDYTLSRDVAYDTMADKSVRGSTANSNAILMNRNFTNASDLKASLQGVKLYFELANPESYTGDYVWVKTATVTNMNMTKTVLVQPSASGEAEYIGKNMSCIGHYVNTLAFVADEVPTKLIEVKVVHMGD